MNERMKQVRYIQYHAIQQFKIAPNEVIIQH